MSDLTWLTMKGPATRWVLQGSDTVFRVAAGVWGVDFSPVACRARGNGARATLWLGPDEYLLWDAAPDALSIGDLERALGPHPHSLVDVSQRQVALELAGPHVATILNGGCPLDLSLEAFPVDMCTRTVLAKAEIVLWRTAPEIFHLEVWRSFLGYTQGILTEYGREFSEAP